MKSHVAASQSMPSNRPATEEVAGRGPAELVGFVVQLVAFAMGIGATAGKAG